MTFLLAYISGALGVAYALMVWFHTGFALHVAGALKALGVFKSVWDTYEEAAPATKDDLDAYLISKIGFPLWLELLCCPYCLSFHTSWILSVAMCIIAPISWWLVPVAILSWPAVANVLFHFTTLTNTTSKRNDER